MTVPQGPTTVSTSCIIYYCECYFMSLLHCFSLQDDDPMVEYEDEFGRIRTARKSEVPRNLVKTDDDLLPPEPEFKCVRDPLLFFSAMTDMASSLGNLVFSL